ncbi:MAG: hypothetical protein JWP37_3234 [Mucilaginibacter sp.]|nr:hypothetical protein [Mucilaginibacter sp.]
MKKLVNLLIVLLTFAGSASMITSCTKEAEKPAAASSNPKADKLDPDSAKGGSALTLTGSGLGQIQSIVFEKGNVTAPFNTVFNTDKALIFRVPDTANGGSQNIIITNKLGKVLKVPFIVIALPVISSVSNYNFTSGTSITIDGNNLGDVVSVKFVGSADAITIVSKTKKELVITMPTNSSVAGAPLIITNSTGPVTTTQVFENLDKAYKIFTDGYGTDGWANNSWGPAQISSTVSKSGTSSFAATYAKGNWSQDGFSNWGNGFASNPSYKYLAFWLKGGSEDYTLYITGDKRAGGFGNSDVSVPITVPANVWTYFKIPLTTLDLWNKGTPFNQLGWWIKGPNDQDETFYFDDVIVVNQ